MDSSSPSDGEGSWSPFRPPPSSSTLLCPDLCCPFCIPLRNNPELIHESTLYQLSVEEKEEEEKEEVQTEVVAADSSSSSSSSNVSEGSSSPSSSTLLCLDLSCPFCSPLRNNPELLQKTLYRLRDEEEEEHTAVWWDQKIRDREEADEMYFNMPQDVSVLANDDDVISSSPSPLSPSTLLCPELSCPFCSPLHSNPELLQETLYRLRS